MINATLRKAGDKSATEAAKAALSTPAPGEATNAFVEQVATEVGDADLKKALGLADGATTGVAPATAQPASTAIATRPSHEVSRFSSASNGGLSGEWGREHVKFPAMKIVQGSGPMSQLFKTGQLVLGDDVLLKEPDPTSKPPYVPTMRFIPLKLDLKWRENVSQEAYAAGTRQRIFNTKAEVEAVGGSTRWVGFGPTAVRPDFQESVTCLLLIEQPTGSEHPNFALEINGKYYAPCVYYATGSGFTRFAKPIFNSQLSLMIPTGKADASGRIEKAIYVPKRIWNWETQKVQAGTNLIFAPSVKMTPEDTSAELRDVVDGILSGLKADHIDADDGE